jgi:uncharacterized protein (TIGR00369 family)
MSAVDQGFFRLLGFELVGATADGVLLRFEVSDVHLQPHGIVHGGVHCAAVESAASVGAALWLGDRGRVVGVANRTDFIRPVSEGVLMVSASPIDRTETQQLWLVEIRDVDSRLVARGEVRLQSLPIDRTAESDGSSARHQAS